MFHYSKTTSQLFMLIVIAALVTLVACSPSTQTTSTATPEPATSEPTVEATEVAASASPTAEDANAVSSDESTASCDKLNLNTLTGDDLMTTIPDFTQRMVREFQEYRPYVSIQQFRREINKYVDMDQVTAWEAYVYVPVDPNDSDAATLMQLPGVDEALADALIASRPYANNEALLIALGESVSADELAQAECFLAAEA